MPILVNNNTRLLVQGITGTTGRLFAERMVAGGTPIVGGVTQTNPPCTQATPCTWATLMSDYPNARINPSVSGTPGLFLNDVRHAGAWDRDTLLHRLSP